MRWACVCLVPPLRMREEGEDCEILSFLRRRSKPLQKQKEEGRTSAAPLQPPQPSSAHFPSLSEVWGFQAPLVSSPSPEHSDAIILTHLIPSPGTETLTGRQGPSMDLPKPPDCPNPLVLNPFPWELLVGRMIKHIVGGSTKEPRRNRVRRFGHPHPISGFPFDGCPLPFLSFSRCGPTTIALLREAPPVRRGWGRGGAGGVGEGTKRGLRAAAGLGRLGRAVRGLRAAAGAQR